MIYHASIGATDPEKTGRTLAEILAGKLFKLPTPYETLTIRMDDGSHLEVWPEETGFAPDPGSQHVSLQPVANHRPVSSFHLFISTRRTADEVLELAQKAGWPAYVRQPRFPFSLIEVWVEGRTMLEVCPEEWIPQFKAVVKNAREITL